MIEAEFFFGLTQEALELRVSQEGDGNNVPRPVLSHVHREMALGDVDGKTILIVAVLLLPQARASFEDLLEDCGLGELVVFSDCHFGREGGRLVWDRVAERKGWRGF